MKQEMFSNFPLMCKYKPQIIYFPSILSAVFVLSHAELKETNK